MYGKVFKLSGGMTIIREVKDVKKEGAVGRCEHV